jgi:hypothetical protein
MQSMPHPLGPNEFFFPHMGRNAGVPESEPLAKMAAPGVLRVSIVIVRQALLKACSNGFPTVHRYQQLCFGQRGPSLD